MKIRVHHLITDKVFVSDDIFDVQEQQVTELVAAAGHKLSYMKVKINGKDTYFPENILKDCVFTVLKD